MKVIVNCSLSACIQFKIPTYKKCWWDLPLLTLLYADSSSLVVLSYVVFRHQLTSGVCCVSNSVRSRHLGSVMSESAQSNLPQIRLLITVYS